MIRKLLKWLLFFLLGFFVCLSAVYFYFASQTGERASDRTVFKRETRRPLVFAHRGGGGLFPENTLGAFEYSAKMGVDVLELDIHETADGALVVHHDATVDRTTDGRGRIGEMTLEAVKKLDAGFRFSLDGDQTFPFRGKGVTIPTLEEILAALPAMTFNVEPKRQTPTIVKSLCGTIRGRKMTDKVIVGSFRQEVLDEFRRECAEVATSASPSEVRNFLTYYKTGLASSYVPPMQALQVPVNVSYLNIVSKDFVETAHRLNLQVHVWTINDAEEMRRLTEMGVDGIMTDYPDRLLNLLKQLNLMPPAGEMEFPVAGAERDDNLQAETDALLPLFDNMPPVKIYLKDEPVLKSGTNTEKGIAYTHCPNKEFPFILMKKTFYQNVNRKQLINALKHELTHAWLCRQGQMSAGHDDRFRRKFTQVGGFGN